MLVVIECSSFQGRWTPGALRLGTEGILGFGANINAQRRVLSFGKRDDVVALGLGLFCAGALVPSFRVLHGVRYAFVRTDPSLSSICFRPIWYVFGFFVMFLYFSVYGEGRRCPVPSRLLLGTAIVFTASMVLMGVG